MDKEKIVTITIGLFVGAALASLYFFGGKLLSKIPSKGTHLITTSAKPSPASPKITPAGISISTPEDNASTTVNPIPLTGQTSPNTPVVLYANADEKIATSDASGKFTANIKLEEGENEVTATIIDITGKPITVKRNITLEISQ